MKKHLFASFVFFALASVSALHPQDSSAYQSPDSQQSVGGNCAEAPSAANGDCPQTPYMRREASRAEAGTSIPSANSTSPESATLGGRNRDEAQERRLPPEPPSEFQKFVAATTGQLLPIYGANLFRNVPSTFSPSDLAPVSSDYVIGPEDELRVRIWGQIVYSGNLRVDRSGDIYLPQAGTIHVAGLAYSALDQHLRSAVARMYRNFDLSVDIGRIRSMQIYVTGQARRPGAYTVSSLSSLVDALFATGGPSAQGSLRRVQLKRAGKTIADFDLYSLLIDGDKSKDVRLLPEDVLYIPPAGSQVALTGSIRNPAIYEVRDGETIGQLIAAAGKTTAMSSRARLSLERVGADQSRQAMEFALDADSLAAPLQDGDILRIDPIVPAYRNTVTLRGNVANPGRFALRPGMRLSDLIPDRDSLVSRDYWWKRSHLGLPVPEFEAAISTIGRNERDAESNGLGFTASVTPETLRSALTTNEQQDSNASSMEPAAASKMGSSGSVASQLKEASGQSGAARVKRNDVSLSAPEINWDYAVIERLDPETLKTSLIPFDLGKLVLSHDPGQDIALQAGDAITVFSQADIRVPLERQTKYIDLEGEFVHSGIYSVEPGETLRDLVRRAGGLTSKAYLYGSEFTRDSTRVLQQQRLDEYVRSVSMESERGTQALAAAASSSASSPSDVTASRVAGQELIARLGQIRATGRIVLEFQAERSGVADVPEISLENGDRFLVPFAPSTINVVGAVNDQNSFLYQHGGSTRRYLRLAGGPSRNADMRHAFVIRADGSVVSRTAANGYWGNGFEQLRLNPGDTIVVPEKTLRPTALRQFMDWSQIFSQLALGAAAINVL